MRLIKFASKLDIDSCERILSSGMISSGDLGINWLKSDNGRMFCYYEDGKRTSRGSYQMVKSYFYGRVKSKNQGLVVSGVIFSAPLLTAVLIALMAFSFCFDFTGEIIPLLLYVTLLLWVQISERKNRNSIAEYLIRVFESADK